MLYNMTMIMLYIWCSIFCNAVSSGCEVIKYCYDGYDACRDVCGNNRQQVYAMYI